MVESKGPPFKQLGLFIFKPTWLGKGCAGSAGFTATLRAWGGSNLTGLTHLSPCMAIIESSAWTAGQSYTRDKRSKIVDSDVSAREDAGNSEGSESLDWLRR